MTAGGHEGFGLPDEDDYRKWESNLTVIVNARRHEPVQEDDEPVRGSKFGGDSIEFQHEGDLVFDKRFGNNLVNIEAYFAPPVDQFYDWANEFTQDGVLYTTGYSTYEFRFELFEKELTMAATQRAREDRSHPVQSLAEWAWLAGGADHVADHTAMTIHKALRKAVTACRNHDTKDEPEWALCHGGDPTDDYADPADPPRTLSEAEAYINYGFDAVEGLRKELDDDA